MGTNSARNVVELITDGVRIRVKGDGAWVSEQVADLLGRLATRPQSSTPPGATPRPIVLRDLLLARTWKTHGDVAAVVAYHLQTAGGRSTWRSGEIVLELRRAAYPLPGNITDALTHRKKQGYFEARDRMWQLTERGIRWVEEELLGQSSLTATAAAEFSPPLNPSADAPQPSKEVRSAAIPGPTPQTHLRRTSPVTQTSDPSVPRPPERTPRDL